MQCRVWRFSSDHRFRVSASSCIGPGSVSWSIHHLNATPRRPEPEQPVRLSARVCSGYGAKQPHKRDRSRRRRRRPGRAQKRGRGRWRGQALSLGTARTRRKFQVRFNESSRFTHVCPGVPPAEQGPPTVSPRCCVTYELVSADRPPRSTQAGETGEGIRVRPCRAPD